VTPAERSAKQDVLRKVSSIGVWHRGDARAPHKPLLVLLALGRLIRGLPRMAPFAEVESPLSDLLRKYGPPRRAQHPEYPFWWLRSDGLWEVPDDHALARRKGSNDPLRSALRATALGGFPREVHAAFEGDRKLIHRCVQSLLRDHFPQSIHLDILSDVGLSSAIPSLQLARDARFREEVISAYEHRCAVCGFDVRVGDGLDLAIEAAHIKWHQAGGPEVVQNGVALCSIHHKAFDLGALTVDRTMRILVSGSVYGQSGMTRWFLRYHRRRVRVPHSDHLQPDPAFLNWHQRQVFREPARGDVSDQSSA
jgi:putative restriction endonuclease